MRVVTSSQNKVAETTTTAEVMSTPIARGRIECTLSPTKATRRNPLLRLIKIEEKKVRQIFAYVLTEKPKFQTKVE